MKRNSKIIIVAVLLASALPITVLSQPNQPPTPSSTPAFSTSGQPQAAPSTLMPSNTGSPATQDISAAERYEYDKLRLERDLQKELLEWAQTRFWILAVLTVLIGFFGVRALVREMIASELRDAMRATAQAQAAAEHTKEVTKDVRADADKYRETVLGLSEAANKVDEQFKALDARISAEGAHAIAASELQLTQLASRVDELSEVVKALASESQESRKLLRDYEARVNALNKVAASKREKFSENSKYEVIVVSHPKNKESMVFGRQLAKLLTERGYRASTGQWDEKHPASFSKIDLHYKQAEPELAARLREITAELVGRLKPDTPIKVIEGPDVTVDKRDAVIFLS